MGGAELRLRARDSLYTSRVCDFPLGEFANTSAKNPAVWEFGNPCSPASTAAPHKPRQGVITTPRTTMLLTVRVTRQHLRCRSSWGVCLGPPWGGCVRAACHPGRSGSGQNRQSHAFPIRARRRHGPGAPERRTHGR